MKLNLDLMDEWYNLNLDIKNRTIYFGAWQVSEAIDLEKDTSWEVHDYSAQNIIKGLHLLESDNHNPIKVIWNSDGGTWEAGMAIYDYIKGLKSPVTIVCYGRVRSMGTIILQAAKERILSPNCLYLMHYGTMGIDSQHTNDAIAVAKRAEYENKIMEDIYLEKIRQVDSSYTREQLQDFIKYDRYLLPKEVIKMGLADKIL
jgi:ATP-dependent Clp protease protease subunit